MRPARRMGDLPGTIGRQSLSPESGVRRDGGPTATSQLLRHIDQDQNRASLVCPQRAHARGDEDSILDADAHLDSHGDKNKPSDRDKNANERTDQYGDSDKHDNSKPHLNGYKHVHSHTDVNAYYSAHSDINRHANACTDNTMMRPHRETIHTVPKAMTTRKKLILPLLFLSLTLALLIAGLIDTRELKAAPPPQANAGLATVAPDASPTPTPFQPSPPTPTYLPTAFPTPESPQEEPEEEEQEQEEEPQPVVEEDTEPVAPLDLPQEQINILLLGSDQRVGEIGFRTDTIILLSLNPKKKTASMVSFPRDLYLYLPGYSYQRINTAMYYGGFSLLAETLEYHFGVKPSHYVMIGLEAFVETIDSLGGINVQVAQTLTDHRTGHGNYTVEAGNVPMDGTTALWYVRARYTTNDFDRTRRQQEVIQAIAKQLLSLNALENGDELFKIYKEHVTTDLTWKDVAPIVPLAAQIGDPAKVERYAIGPGQVVSWVTPGGAQVLLPQKAAIQAVIRQAVDP